MMSRRKQAKPRSLKDPNSKPEKPVDHGQEAHLNKKLVSRVEDEDEDEEVLHSCDGCRLQFQSLSDLAQHRINHCQPTDGADVEDERCPTSSPSSKEQASPSPGEEFDFGEEEGGTGLPYPCRLCEWSFSRPGLLRRHEKRHGDKLPFSCTFCSRLFKHKRSRDRHAKLHAGDRLRMHTRTHGRSGKPHRCSVCLRGFPSASSLRAHMQAHERQGRGKLKETQKCGRCEEGFDVPEELQKHISECHPEGSPPQGSSKELFVEQGALVIHVQQVHDSDEQGLSCSVDTQRFHAVEQLYNHGQPEPRNHSNSPLLTAAGYTSVSSTTPDSNLSVDSSALADVAPPPAPKTRRRKRDAQNTAGAASLSAKQAKITYSCVYCKKKVFNSLVSLQIHIKTMHLDRPEQAHTCQYCLEVLPSLQNLKEHLRQAHNPYSISDTVLQCNFCPEVLSDLNTLQEHIRCEHGFPGPMAKESNAFFCPQCFMGFLTESGLEEHNRRTHCNGGGVGFGSPVPVTPLKDPLVQVYSCSYCTNSPIFNTILKLNKHIKENHKNIPLALNYVNNGRTSHWAPSPLSPVSMEQASIKQSHVASEFICSQCGAKYTCVDLFQTHLKTHVDYTHPELSCPQCNKECPGQEALMKHIAVHFTITSTYYSCESCDKQFTCVDELQKHLLDMHTFVSFHCSLCQEVFHSKVSIQLHLAVKHSNENKVYRCTSCSWDFRHEADLQLHVKHNHLENQGEVHRCIFCRESFSTEVELQCHITSHRKKYNCMFCSKAFHAVAALEKHLRDKHCVLETEPQNGAAAVAEQAVKDDVELQGHPADSRVSQGTPEVSEEDADGSEPMHGCDICGAAYTMDSLLINHQLRDHNIRPGESAAVKKKADLIKGNHKCGVCSRTFFSEGGLREHAQTHLGPVKHYACPICGERFPSLLTLTEHKVTHSKSLDTGRCRMCRLPLRSQEDFLEHCQMHPDLRNSLTGFRCVVCLQTVTSALELKIHGTFHMQKTGGPASVAPLPYGQPHQPNKLYRCSSCLKEFHSEQNLIRLDVHGLPYNLCSVCVTTSSKSSSPTGVNGEKKAVSLLGQAERLSPGSATGGKTSAAAATTRCSSCSVKFESEVELQSHILSVHREAAENSVGSLRALQASPMPRASPSQAEEKKTYQCIKCQMVFYSEWDIQVHVANHMLEEGLNHECKICNQTFDSPAKLQCHLIQHSFEGMGGTFKCPVCFTVFVQAGKLQQHIFSTHGQEDKMYDCSQCSQKFFFQTELQNHTLSLHKS